MSKQFGEWVNHTEWIFQKSKLTNRPTVFVALSAGFVYVVFVGGHMAHTTIVQKIAGCLVPILLVLGFSGCEKELVSEAASNTTVTALQYEKIVLPGGIRNPSNAEIRGNTLYCLTENNTEQFLFSMNLSDETYSLTKLLDYDEAKRVIRLAVNDDCCCYETMEQETTESGEIIMHTSLSCVRYDGEICFSVDLDEDTVPGYTPDSYIESLSFLGDGTLLLSTSTSLLQMDLQGNLLNQDTFAEDNYVIQKAGDDTVYLKSLYDNGVYSFDPTEFSIGNQQITGDRYQTICRGNQAKELIGLDETGAEVLFLGANSEHIPLPDKGLSGVQSILMDENNNVYILRTNLDTYDNELYRVVDGVYCEPETLTIAVSDLESIEPSLNYLVEQYNFEHNDYQIKLSTYTDEELSGLFAENKAPDMMLFGNDSNWTQFTLDLCARNHFVIDLSSYLDSDLQLHQESFVPNVLKHMSTENGLYGVTYGFRIRTIYAKKAYGVMENWTLDEFLDVAGKLPEGVMITDATQVDFLTTTMQWCLDSFVFDTSCDFECDTFYELLQLCKTGFPEEYDENVFQNADDFLLNYSFSIGDFSMLCSDLEMLGDDAVFTGFPNANGGQLLYAPMLCVTSSCKNPDVAWDFLRTYITMGNTGTYISVLQENYATQLNAWSDLFSSDTISGVDTLVQGATTVTDFYSPIPAIVAEEAQAYFSGDKSAEEVAAIIQNRVQIYLSEQT